MSTTSLSQIVKDLDLAKNIQTFNQLLDTPPKPEWVKKNPFVKNQGKELEYIPVSIYRKLLRDIFQHFNIEVLDSKVVFNAIQVTVRVHYMHPVSGEWRFVDGIGAMALQTEKGAKAMDAQSLRSDAVQKAAPAAKSYALKNALAELGDIFGGSLNSDVIYEMEDVYAEPKPDLSEEKAKAELDKINDVDKLQPLYDRLATNFTMSYEIDEMFKSRYNEIVPEEKTPPKAKPKNEPQAPIINDLAKSDEDRIKKALSKASKASDINSIYTKLQSEGVDVKSFNKLFTEAYKKLTNETA